MPRESLLIDFDNVTQKRSVLTRLGVLKGQWRVELIPYRARRSDQQNKWYHPCIVGALFQFLREQDYDITHPDDAHEILKAKFLTVDVLDPQTGQVIGKRVRSTTTLSTAEFSDYCDRCRAWMLDFFGIVCPDPTPELTGERTTKRGKLRMVEG